MALIIRRCIDWNPLQPIYETPPEKYLAERVLRILLDCNISPSKVYHERPVNIRESATFVADITNLHHEKDLASGITVARILYPSTWFIMKMAIDRCAPGATGTNVVRNCTQHIHQIHRSKE